MSYRRHDWVDDHNNQSLRDQISDMEFRRCKACGATQSRSPDYAWMRKTGRGAWRPKLSPKCEGKQT